MLLIEKQPSHDMTPRFIIYSKRGITHLALVPNRVSIGSDNGLPPIRRQAIILTNAGLLSIGPTNFSELLVKSRTFSFKNMRLKLSSAKWRPFCPGEDELIV